MVRFFLKKWREREMEKKSEKKKYNFAVDQELMEKFLEISGEKPGVAIEKLIQEYIRRSERPSAEKIAEVVEKLNTLLNEIKKENQGS